MAALRRSSLGTRLFLSLATMLVPLVLVAAVILVSHYRHTGGPSHNADREIAALLALLLAGIAVALLFARSLYRQITGPLTELHAAAYRVARDDFSQPIKTTTDDELGVVGEAFNAMMERLRHSRGELVHQAFHDALTGLPNRALFQDRTEQALTRSHRGRRHDGTAGHVAVLFLDLDDFKGVNDGFGHGTGDQLLKTVATRLRDTLRSEDTIARLGGDEFAILLEQLPDHVHAERAADRLLQALTKPITINGRDHTTDASVGVAVSTRPTDTAEELLRNADVAMYAAKAAGRGRRATFAPKMHTEVFSRVSIEADLRRALDRDEFRLVYQPVLDLQTRRTVAVEALLRWDHPEKGEIAPARFIPAAERSGLIIPLGRWVLEQATAQAATFQQLPGANDELTVAVNLSPRQLQDPHLVGDVERALDEAGIAPETLVLELTETLLTTDMEATVPVLNELKRLGVLLAIDDVGAGYSSLSYLRRFPIDVLKLDRELVSGDEHDAKLTRALLGLGRELDLATIAEGIERPEQLAELKRLGCDLGQGFLFAKPMPAAQLVERLGGVPVSV